MKDDKSNPLVYLFKKNWQYAEGLRHRIFLYWGLFVLAALVNLFMLPIIGAKITQIIAIQGVNTESIRLLGLFCSLFVLRSILFWGLHMPARVLEQINAFHVKINYRKYLVKGILTLPLEWHAEHHSGDTIDKVEKGATGLYNFSEDSYENIYSLVQLLVSYGMLLIYFSKFIGLVALPMLLFSAWITIRFDKYLIPKYKELNRADNLITESTADAFTNISTVIILRVEKYVFEAISHKLEKPFELYKKTIKIDEFKWYLTSVCCNTMYAISLFVFFWQNFGAGPGAVSGSVYLLMRYLDEIGELFFKFAGSYSNVVKRRTRVSNSEELSQDFKPENFANHVLPENWNRLDVRNLSFSYHGDGEVLHLDNVSFSVNHGERVALVGETGSGKTTFLKIMRDLYHPQNLSLSVDGQLVPSGFEGISRAITLVQQDPQTFARTVGENISMGAEYETDFVLKFTDMACFTDVVNGLPKGFDSSIKERGVNLSGGQKQRLALSRGLLACHDKDIVLLDEPTSSLDTITEITVYQNIFRGFSGKTIISTIHQLHLLPLFDRICVFDKGQIIASGTLNELLISCPKFVSLWEAMQRTATGNTATAGK